MKYCAVYFPQGMDDDLRLIRERYARAKAAGYRGPGAGPPPYYDPATGDWEYPPVPAERIEGEEAAKEAAFQRDQAIWAAQYPGQWVPRTTVEYWAGKPIIPRPDYAITCKHCRGLGQIQDSGNDETEGHPIECPHCGGMGWR